MNSCKLLIGMPVFNGEKEVGRAIESIRNQTFGDFKLLIFDNCSNDNTGKICQDYAKADSRIYYVRHPINLGAHRNFMSLVEHADAPYFMWAAVDDVRTPEYLEVNITYLESHPECVASTSPNCFEGEEDDPTCHIDFSIFGSLGNRMCQILDNCWDSHAIFYSVMRADIIKNCDVPNHPFLGFDWAINLFLAKNGNINRTDKGLLILGRKGISNNGNIWRMFRKSTIHWIAPFYDFSLYYLSNIAKIPIEERINIVINIIKLNISSAYHQLYSELFPYYLNYIRPLIKRK
ncbi:MULTISPECIES: glycosyltransferase family 2 protein [Thalassospira]|nr:MULTISPECIES: glycosyltransferase family A protein [Thalassospira]MCH2273497.1 glycosyltransferase family 2 protein [Thalassospira sp.]